MEVRGTLIANSKKDKNQNDMLLCTVGDVKFNVHSKYQEELYPTVNSLRNKNVIAEYEVDGQYNQLESISLDESAPQPPAPAVATTETWINKDVREYYDRRCANLIHSSAVAHLGDELAVCQMAKNMTMFYISMCTELGLFDGVKVGGEQIGQQTKQQPNPVPPTTNLTWDDIKLLAKAKGIKTPNQLNEVLGTKDYKKEMNTDLAKQIIEDYNIPELEEPF